MNRVITFLFFLLTTAISTYAQSQSGNRYEKESNIKKPLINLDKQIHLYPNPTKEYLNAEILSSELKTLTFSMYNIIGNPIDVKLEKLYGNKYRLDVTDYESGYYILMIKDKKTHFRQAFKFLKE